MTHKTKFEIMRRNRCRRPCVAALVDGVETEMEREWHEVQRAALQERQQRFDNTADWISDTRDQARAKVGREPEPGLCEVLLFMLASSVGRLWRSIPTLRRSA